MDAQQMFSTRHLSIWVQQSAMWLIAVLLFAHLVIEYAWPWAVLLRRESNYFNAATLCHEALSNLDAIEGAADKFDSTTAQALHISAIIGSLDCYERQSLRSYLLAQGVSPSKLDEIDLAAKLSSQSELPYVVDGLIKK